jgi:hypothetical protein
MLSAVQHRTSFSVLEISRWMLSFTVSMVHGLFPYTLSFRAPIRKKSGEVRLPQFLFHTPVCDYRLILFQLFSVWLPFNIFTLSINYLTYFSNPSHVYLTKGTLVQFCIIYHLGMLCNHQISGFLPVTHNCILTINLFPLTKSYTNILLHYTASCLSYFLY